MFFNKSKTRKPEYVRERSRSVVDIETENKPFLGLTKRHKIIITTVILFFGFLFVTQASNIIYKRYFIVVGFGVLTYILSLWSLWEGMTKTKAIILLILPVLYCIGMSSFYYLFREIRWLTRIPIAVFFGLSYYLLLLSQNVFSVASVRTIPLYRAASSTSFVYTVFTSVLLVLVIFSFELPFYLNGVLTAAVVFPLFLQILWTVKMARVDSQIVVYSVGLSLIAGELAMAFSFWPQMPFVKSLFLASIIYSLLGIVLEFVRERLNSREVMEYVLVGVGVFIFVFGITTWLLG